MDYIAAAMAAVELPPVLAAYCCVVCSSGWKLSLYFRSAASSIHLTRKPRQNVVNLVFMVKQEA
jgi:hypothetical protein